MADAGDRRRYERFAALHDEGIFVMPNAFDALSAAVFADAGFPAIASSSAALAASLGRRDATHAISRGEQLAHSSLLARASGLPVSGDFEDGYGESLDVAAATVAAAAEAGLAGVAIEDTTGDPRHPIRDFDEVVARVRRAAAAAQGRIVLAARTENYLFGRPDLDDTIRRLSAFAEVGADVLFAPYLPDLDAIRAVVDAVAPKPVSVLLRPETSATVIVDELREAGVRRISQGIDAYLHALDALRGAALELAAGDLTAMASTIGQDLHRPLSF